MREGWETKKLGEVIELEYGKPLPKEDRNDNGHYPAYGANGEKCRTNKFYWEKPSIIVGRKGSAGEIRLSAERFWPLDVTYFVTFDDGKYDLFFLYHCLESLQLTKLAKGVKPGINRNDVYQLEFCFPPLAEQKRIVGVLDEAFAAIGVAVANAQKNLANARELFETTLNNIFSQMGEGWVKKPISDVCVSIVDCINRTAPKSDIPTQFKMIRTTNVRHGKINLTKVNYVTEETYKIWTRRQTPEVGDIILTREAPMGEVGILETSDQVFLGQRLVSYRIDPTMAVSNFIYYQMRSAAIQDQIENNASGSTVQHMRVPASKSLLVTLPDIKTQKKLCELLDNLSIQTHRLEAIYRQKLDDLAELKQSILQKAFAGELTAGNVVSFPETSRADEPVDTTSPAFVASVIAFGYARHVVKKRDKTYGRVKAQKNLHLIESIGDIDLGRKPEKDAAGPNDFAHMLRAEKWARAQQFFEFVQRPDGGYDFIKLPRYEKMKAKALAELKPYRDQLEKVTNLLIQMDTKQAEVFATIHSAWNNLIIDGAEITDDAILYEARENWHSDKLKIPVSQFKKAIRKIRDNDVVPAGIAKRVGGQGVMF